MAPVEVARTGGPFHVGAGWPCGVGHGVPGDLTLIHGGAMISHKGDRGGDAPFQGAGTEAARPDVGDSTHREVPHDRTAGGPAGSQEGARCFQKGLGNQ